MGTDKKDTTPQEEKKNTMLMPVVGLMLMIALGLIAFGVREPAQDFMADNVENFPRSTQAEDGEMAGYLVAGVIFVLELMVSVIVYAALFAAKPDRRVTEKDLKEEKRFKEKELLERKKLKRHMREEAAKEGKGFREQD